MQLPLCCHTALGVRCQSQLWFEVLSYQTDSKSSDEHFWCWWWVICEPAGEGCSHLSYLMHHFLLFHWHLIKCLHTQGSLIAVVTESRKVEGSAEIPGRCCTSCSSVTSSHSPVSWTLLFCHLLYLITNPLTNVSGSFTSHIKGGQQTVKCFFPPPCICFSHPVSTALQRFTPLFKFSSTGQVLGLDSPSGHKVMFSGM